MNRNVLIVLAGGLLVAVLVAVLLGALLGGGGKKKKQQVTQQEPRIEILVASKNIGVAQKLTEDNIQWKKWPQSGAFPGTVKRKGGQKPLEALGGGRVSRKIAQGEPVLKSAIIEAGGNYVAASLKPGMRAMAVKVGAADTAGGFVSPGDYVDIMLTYRQKIEGTSQDKTIKAMQDFIVEQNFDKYATETILQNVKVLAIDQSAIRNEEKVQVGKTATLEVTPRQAEVLAVAQKAGDLSLALRGIGDEVVVVSEAPIVTDARTTGIFDEIIAEFDKSFSAGVSTNSVKIYRGDQVESVGVKQ